MSASIRFILISVSVCFLLVACGDQTETAGVAEITSAYTAEIAEPLTGAWLQLALDSTEIDLSESVRATVSLRWDPGVEVELIDPDWDSGQWNSAREIKGEIEFDGRSYSQQIAFELEPFLGGSYEIPSIGIRATSNDTGRRIVRLAPIGVEVTSVLAEGDGDELDTASGLAELNRVPDDSRKWNVIGGLVLGISGISVLAWTLLQNKSAGETQIDPESVLAVAASSAKLSDEDIGSLHRAMVELSKDHSEIKTLSDDIEHERFSGNAVDHQRIRQTAKRALELCGNGGMS